MLRAALVSSPVTLLRGHLPALDGLRGLAILLVLVHNLDIYAPTPGAMLLARLYKEAAYVGWIGVQLFFVLSGFLITRVLLASQGDPHYFRNFYARRVLRIFPLYYLALVVFTGLLPALGLSPVQNAHGSPLWLWFYLSNWTQTIGLGGDQLPHFWSLAVEEQFYLLWPLLLWRRSPRQTLFLACGLVVLTPFLRAWMLVHHLDPGTVYVSTFARMDALAAGAAVAAFLATPGRSERSLDWRIWAVMALLAASLAVLGSHGFQRLSPAGQVFGYSLLAAAFAASVAAAAATDVRRAGKRRQPWWYRLLCHPALRMIGCYSYAIYVFHKPLDQWLGQRVLLGLTGGVETTNGWIAAAYLLSMGSLSVLIGGASWYLFERHFLKLKSHFDAAAPASPSAQSLQLGMPLPSR